MHVCVCVHACVRSHRVRGIIQCCLTDHPALGAQATYYVSVVSVHQGSGVAWLMSASPRSHSGSDGTALV